MLKDDIAAPLDWRASKAEEYPDDQRNMRAVEILLHLEETADDVPPTLMAEYDAVFLRWDTTEVVVIHADALRGVGFHSTPVNATEFVRHFIETANADRRRFEPPPAPRLAS